MSDFSPWLPYDFESGKGDHLGQLVFRIIDSWVYPSVDREFRHFGPYIAWENDVTRATL